jgi:phosphoserine phosphatase RsbU/P
MTDMADRPRPVLVADDQPDVVAALRLLLRSAGFDPQGASSVQEVRAQVASRQFDAVLMDLNYARDTTSGAEGLALIADLHKQRPDLPLIAMTGWANVETAVEAMRRGARGYIAKPWSNETLVQVLRDEIAHAASVRSTTGSAREWRDALAVQRALLPATLPSVPGCRVAARWEPASGLGGDYYDVFALDGGRLAVCIGDVCGKGLPAALLVSSLQATVRAVAESGGMPHEVVARANQALCRQGTDGRFVTLFVAVFDPRDGTLTYCNGGHNAPILVRADGRVERLDAGGMIVGVFEPAPYEPGRVSTGSGDRLLLFTDGVVDAGVGDRDEYGDARLTAAMVGHQHPDPATLIERVFDDIHNWAGPALEDDATAMALTIGA